MNKLSLALLVSSALLAQSAISAENNHTMSYLTSWGLPSGDAVAQLEKSKVDTFFLSFGGWDSNGNITSSDKILAKDEYNPDWMDQSYITWTQLKLANPGKKMMLAFGGETYESMWSHLGSADNREKIAQGLVKLLNTEFPVYKKGLTAEEMDGQCRALSWDQKQCNMNAYQKAGTVYLDGIDFDYEKAARLTEEENNNLLELVKRVRQLLGPQSKKLLSLTTYHVGADPEACMDPKVIQGCSFIEDKRSSHHGEVKMLLAKGKNLFDFFNVMTYDAGKQFKYEVAMENYARLIGDKSKILLGNTINEQWGSDERFTETDEKNVTRAAWQSKNNYGGFFVWALGSNNKGVSFADQIQKINDMHQAAKDAKATEGNQKPTALAKFPQVVTGAASVDLDGSLSTDPEGETLHYRWEQISGPEVTLTNADQVHASFSLNTTDKDQELMFRLTVNDGELDSEPFEFTIKHKSENVVIENQKPIASVKYPKEMKTGLVSLDGRDSVDPEGETLSYKWQQISGPTVTLNGAEQSQASFELNSTTKDVDLVFQLVVNDGELDSDPYKFTIKHKAEKGEDVHGDWQDTKIYVAGDVVKFQGKEYKAKWWTKGDRPGSSDVWENLNKEIGGEWNSNNVYLGGDEVSFQGKSWIAKWWTKGDKPGSSDVWKVK